MPTAAGYGSDVTCGAPQASYGRRMLSLTGILSYLGLALGLLGGNLALSFGLYLVLTQREPERSPRDDVSGVSNARAYATIGAVAFSFLVLLPLGVDPGMVDPNDLNSMPPLQTSIQDLLPPL